MPHVFLNQSNQTLAGVVGIDIPVFVMENLSPRRALGPLGYAFAINQNGHLLFHPSMWMDANYLQEPAHIDLYAAEGETDVVESLRRAMIALPATAGQVTENRPLDYESNLPLGGQRHYDYIAVGDTKFA